MFRLDDKVALVTGAARGLGKATALMLSKAGARVVLVDVRLKEMEAVARDCGSNSKLYQVDVSSISQVKQLVDDVERDFGRIDILVNNAGICPRLSFPDSTEKDWEELINVNAKSQYFMMQAVFPMMKKQGGGRIVNIASTAGRTGSFANASIYSGAKGAIVMFSKSVAREVAADGILINCIAPGVLDTDIMRDLPPDRIRSICDQIPLKRLGRPDEIASVIVFLASDECSYCTGATFDVNGGWVML